MKVKVESEKVDLRLNIQKTKIMACGPITSWEIDGETVSNFILRGSKITADGDFSHEIKRCLLLGRKVMTNLDSIFKKHLNCAGKKGAQGRGRAPSSPPPLTSTPHLHHSHVDAASTPCGEQHP